MSGIVACSKGTKDPFTYTMRDIGDSLGFGSERPTQEHEARPARKRARCNPVGECRAGG
jgi:hypothetical protein